jgi:hypothetical protein
LAPGGFKLWVNVGQLQAVGQLRPALSPLASAKSPAPMNDEASPFLSVPYATP